MIDARKFVFVQGGFHPSKQSEEDREQVGIVRAEKLEATIMIGRSVRFAHVDKYIYQHLIVALNMTRLLVRIIPKRYQDVPSVMHDCM